MKPRRRLAVALTAAIALTALLAATAQALPEFLLSAKPNNVFTGTATGTSTLENTAGTKVECTKANSSGGLETDTLGTLHITFESCSSSGVKCTTEGDLTGLILAEGSFHFVYDALGTGETLGVAALFLLKETEFTCLGGLINDKVKGTVLCLILTPLTSTVTHQFHCLKGTKAGEAGEKSYWNDEGGKVEAQLLSKLNEEPFFKETNLQMLSTFTTPEAGLWMNE
jgi:hypothetical protein